MLGARAAESLAARKVGQSAYGHPPKEKQNPKPPNQNRTKPQQKDKQKTDTPTNREQEITSNRPATSKAPEAENPKQNP